MDKKVDVLIVGQGIAGTILSYKMLKRGYTVKVIDDGHRTAASTKAAGIINPITGRSYVKSWMIDDLMPVAKSTYQALENELEGKYYHEHNIIRVLGSVYEENKWSARLLEDSYSDYIINDYDTSYLDSYYNKVDSTANIRGARVDLHPLLSDYRNWLRAQDAIVEERFNTDELTIRPKGVMYYKDLEVDKLVFADGVQSIDNVFFPDLPFQPNKGQVLIVRIPNYEVKDIVKHGIFICPIGDDRYWVGAGYEREFDDDKPTRAGKKRLKQQLEYVLKLDYEILEHISGIRPSVKGRKPLLGRSTVHDSIYLFSGLGTKGSSLAPYWAQHLIDFMESKVHIHEEVDFNRF